MGRALLANNASTTLSAAISSTGATTFSVVSTAGFPSVTTASGDYFYCTLVDGANIPEIVKVTDITGLTCICTRAQDGTTARTFLNGATVSLRLVAAVLDELQDKASKDMPGGYPSLVGQSLKLWNATKTHFTLVSVFGATMRAILLPDKDGTVAMTSDITGVNSGTNTGDETTATIKTKLGVTILSGDNTGDQTLASLGAQATLVSGTNIKTINGVSIVGSGDVAVGGLARVLVTTTTQAAASGSDYWATNVAATTLTAPTAADGAKFAFTPVNGLLTNAIDFGAATVLGYGGATASGIITLSLGAPMEFEYSTTLAKWVMA